MLSALGHEGDIVASTEPQKMYNLHHQVVDLGSDMQPNAEALLRAKPDIVLLTDYGFENPMAKVAKKAGIRVKWLREWQEQDPLARAGWLDTIASLVDEHERADSILNEVRQRYQTLKQDLPKANRKLVLSGQDYRGTWYVPSSHSYLGQIIYDAGGRLQETETSEGVSQAMTIEQVIRSYGKAPIWIGVQVSSLEELKQLDNKHSWITAYQKKQVYNWARRQTSAGANDYWETGVYRPDLILQDILSALRGEEKGYFMRKLGN